MQTTAIVSPSFVERHQPQIAGSYFVSKPNFICRFRRFIETSDWDARFLRAEMPLNGLCALFVGSALLYWASMLVMRFLP